MFKSAQSTTRLNEPPRITLTHNKTPNKLQRSFIDCVYKRYIDCKVMLHYDGKLNIGVKLGSVGCFTAIYRVLQC